MIELIDLKKNNLINLRKLVEFYKKGFFPMADSRHAKTITFFKPLKRFIIPINNFHVPKKLFGIFKKKSMNLKLILILNKSLLYVKKFNVKMKILG